MKKNLLIYGVGCHKVVYGTVTATLLSYKKMTGHLMDWEFEMNSYKPCCRNKIINGKLLSIVFHMDDLKQVGLDG